MESPLSKTDIAILKFLTANLTKDFTILKIAENTGKTIRLTYAAVRKLVERRIIIREEKANLKLCRLNLKLPQIISYVESIRWHDFAKKNGEVNLVVSDIIEKSSLPYFTILVFGSYARGVATKASDVDLLIIIPDKKFEDIFEVAVKSAKSLTTITLHHIIVSYQEFLAMLSEKKTNVAKEVLETRYITYGAEQFYTIVGRGL